MADFVKVKSRKNRKKQEREICTQSKIKTITDIRFTLSSTEFMKDTLERIKCSLYEKNKDSETDCCDPPDVHIVCYGLGNFAESYIARYQMAFLLALRDSLQVPGAICEVYDPQFVEEEVSILRELGLTVLDCNQEGKRPCDPRCKTVFFMPHCGKALYNNVLWSNWGLGLRQLVVIGNSFTRMIESTPERILKKTANYVLRIQDYTKEQELSVPEDYEDIFNDTSIHTFLFHCKQEVPGALWEASEEPVYDSEDAEIIFR